jgi:hypothetical protein
MPSTSATCAGSRLVDPQSLIVYVGA